MQKRRPVPKRGKKKTVVSPEEKEYRLQKKLRALTQVGVRVLHSLRQALDARPDTRQRQLLVSGDGTYTNRTVLRQLPERTTFIGRIRKDAKLFLRFAARQWYPLRRQASPLWRAGAHARTSVAR